MQLEYSWKHGDEMSTPHTIQAAMDRGELNEDEAYFVLRFAGHLGYDAAIKRLSPNRLREFRRWFIWLGGWEPPDLRVWDDGEPRWRFGNGPTPITLLRRLTIQHWGATLRCLGGYLTLTWRGSSGRALYFSPTGTPRNATWGLGLDKRDRR